MVDMVVPRTELKATNCHLAAFLHQGTTVRTRRFVADRLGATGCSEHSAGLGGAPSGSPRRADAAKGRAKDRNPQPQPAGPSRRVPALMPKPSPKRRKPDRPRRDDTPYPAKLRPYPDWSEGRDRRMESSDRADSREFLLALHPNPSDPRSGDRRLPGGARASERPPFARQVIHVDGDQWQGIDSRLPMRAILESGRAGEAMSIPRPSSCASQNGFASGNQEEWTLSSEKERLV